MHLFSNRIQSGPDLRVVVVRTLHCSITMTNYAERLCQHFKTGAINCLLLNVTVHFLVNRDIYKRGLLRLHSCWEAVSLYAQSYTEYNERLAMDCVFVLWKRPGKVKAVTTDDRRHHQRLRPLKLWGLVVTYWIQTDIWGPRKEGWLVFVLSSLYLDRRRFFSPKSPTSVSAFVWRVFSEFRRNLFAISPRWMFSGFCRAQR